MLIVVENLTLGPAPRRLVVSDEQLAFHEARGWVALGETTDPTRDPITTDVEHAEAETAFAARLASLAAPQTGAVTASRPSK